MLNISRKISDEGDGPLWDKFKSGDIEAYEFIYRSKVRDLFNYGMSISQDDAMVKDCIQELFLEIWKSRENLSATDNIKYYLFKALRYKLNHSKTLAQKTKPMDGQMAIYNKLISFPFEEEIIRKQQIVLNKRKIEQAIAKLTSRQREVITLSFYEGLSYDEIASLMSMRVDSVYTLVWKAISRLKTLV